MAPLFESSRHLDRFLFVASAQRKAPHNNRNRQTWSVVLGAALALSGCKSSAPASAPATHGATQPASQPHTSASQPALDIPAVAASTISAEALRRHVYTLADDAFEGRGADTQGLFKAAAYIENYLKKIEAAPAFGDTFRQDFEMTVRVEIGKKNRLASGKKVASSARPLGFSDQSKTTVTADAVFAGYGVRSKEHDYDDYAGVDIAGKIAVVLEGEPGDDDAKSPFDGTRRTRHSSAAFKATVAREAKAVALVIVKKNVRTPKAPQAPAGIPVMAISHADAKDLFNLDAAKMASEIAKAYKPQSAALKSKVSLFADLIRRRKTVPNVGAFIGPEDATEVVVLGAHYDHLGLGEDGSLEEKPDGLIHNGADDNASGVAALLEAGAYLKTQQLKRRVLILFFAGEEAGLLGSAHFVANPNIPVKDITAMINLDMVGRLRADKLNVFGVATAKEWTGLVNQIAAPHNLKATLSGDGYGPSDHTSFYAGGVPVLHLFTGAHSEYHRPSDDSSTLDYRGLARVTAFATDLAHGLAISQGRPTYIRAPAPKAHGSSGRGYGAYFGSVPDFGQDVEGVRFADIRPGSPAAKAGVKKSDVLVAFDGVKVLNLRDFTYALRKAAPGDKVDVVVLRDGKRLTLSVTLERRSN